MDPDNGTLNIILVKNNRVQKTTPTLTQLQTAQLFLYKGSYTIRQNNLPKEENYFSIEIANLPPASNYSLLLFGKEYRVGYIDVCARQTGIEIENGKVTSVELSWSPFLTEPVAPPDGSVFGSNTVRLKWRSMDEASYYHLSVADDSTFTRPIIYSSVSEDAYEIDSQLLQKGKYYWKVRCVGRWTPKTAMHAGSSEAFYCSGAWSRISHFVYE
jgi:hypothetical protein